MVEMKKPTKKFRFAYYGGIGGEMIFSAEDAFVERWEEYGEVVHLGGDRYKLIVSHLYKESEIVAYAKALQEDNRVL